MIGRYFRVDQYRLDDCWRSDQGFEKRAGDAGTAGGNAYSGATNDVSGGSVVNAADDRGAIANGGGNAAGGAGTTFSGDADGGNGNGLGPGVTRTLARRGRLMVEAFTTTVVPLTTRRTLTLLVAAVSARLAMPLVEGLKGG
ncbi:hypothetical protein NUW54_g3958 [Trametes sanguinea]|uniref:Uncharacterized protein n=1 Tax=Trametes sanguinea TaxID=158606 RepID=A0ACC1Q174_9APHY|nr:hypothetical protein NUW54_g3958 [Trametes sanguinea]